MKRSMLLTLAWVTRTSAYVIVIVFIAFFLSCSDEVRVPVPNESFIFITGIAGGVSEEEFDGDGDDRAIHTLRVLAFDEGGNCEKNVLYFGAALAQNIRFPIKKGTYTFVFLANEPVTVAAGILPENVTTYSDLNAIAYPAAAFTSDLPIPMMQEIIDVAVSEGQVQYGAGITATAIEVDLRRLAVRVDVILQSEDEILGELFAGVIFSNLPAEVPLMDINGSIARTTDEPRTFTIAHNNAYFEEKATNPWRMKINRIILPANVLADADNIEGNGIDFTVLMGGRDIPSCKLKIVEKNYKYNLPKNSRLELIATINNPLEVNMTASEWESDGAEWQTAEIRTLNVSHTSAEITDFNGARISFSSNMPVVRVEEEVSYLGGSLETNAVFNDLAVTEANPLPTRFYYDADKGSGYMDVLADAVNNKPGTYAYTLTLIAEDKDGKNQLKRKIEITVTQYGTRFDFSAWGNFTGYVGAFFRCNEVGERIITGQHEVGEEWWADVIEGEDWIVLSSAPSFDPKVGTDNPGHPEGYKVHYHEYKNKPANKGSVYGKGRIYFRVGTAGTISKNEGNRYGIIQLTFHYNNTQSIQKLYIRQGEADDYVFGPGEKILSGVYIDKCRTAARKFSPYNLTTSAFKSNPMTLAYEVGCKGGDFVEYPTQAGAFFQWGTNYSEVPCRAFNPAYDTEWDYEFADAEYNNHISSTEPIIEFWDKLIDDETCPNGYYRPNDGYTNKVAYNGSYGQSDNALSSVSDAGDYSDEILGSTFRMSLFAVPKAGNSLRDSIYVSGVLTSVIIPTYPSGSPLGYEEKLNETQEGLYADGFFDRRPIKNVGDGALAVSIDNANVAYKGLLFFNEMNNKSLFFPSAGRLNDNDGTLEYRGGGYYWSSSTGPWYPKAHNPAWWLGLNYYHMEMGTNIKSFGCSIRCVKEETTVIK